MSEITERLKVAIADRYLIERVGPALEDTVPVCPSGHVAARRAEPSRGFGLGTTRGGTT